MYPKVHLLIVCPILIHTICLLSPLQPPQMFRTIFSHVFPWRCRWKSSSGSQPGSDSVREISEVAVGLLSSRFQNGGDGFTIRRPSQALGVVFWSDFHDDVLRLVQEALTRRILSYGDGR